MTGIKKLLHFKDCHRFFCRELSSIADVASYAGIEKMPGPKSFPVIGTSWIYSFLGPYSFETMYQDRYDMYKEYGPIYREKLAGHDVVSIHRLQDFQIVLKSQGKYPIRNVNQANIQRRKSLPDIYNSVGLVDSQGEEWHNLRRNVAPRVLKPKVVHSHLPQVSRITEEFISLLQHYRDPETNLITDIVKYLCHYTFEVTCAISFGKRIGALEKSLTPFVAEMMRATDIQFKSLAALNLSSPLYKWFNTPLYKQFCYAEDKIHSLVSALSKEAFENTELNDRNKNTILNSFRSTENLDIKDMNTVLIDLIAAGISTTSVFIALLLHRLGKEPRVLNNLHNEINNVVKSEQEITENMIKNMPYLKATIKEGYRLTTIIPCIARLLPESVTIQNYTIPAYTPFLVQTQIAGTLEEYSPYPFEFLPERWIQDHPTFNSLSHSRQCSLSKQIKHPFLIIPYGFGGRMCIGKVIAEMEIMLTLIKIIKNFEIVSSGDLKLTNKLIIYPGEDVNIKLFDRI